MDLYSVDNQQRKQKRINNYLNAKYLYSAKGRREAIKFGKKKVFHKKAHAISNLKKELEICHQIYLNCFHQIVEAHRLGSLANKIERTDFKSTYQQENTSLPLVKEKSNLKIIHPLGSNGINEAPQKKVHENQVIESQNTKHCQKCDSLLNGSSFMLEDKAKHIEKLSFIDEEDRFSCKTYSNGSINEYKTKYSNKFFENKKHEGSSRTLNNEMLRSDRLYGGKEHDRRIDNQLITQSNKKTQDKNLKKISKFNQKENRKLIDRNRDRDQSYPTIDQVMEIQDLIKDFRFVNLSYVKGDKKRNSEFEFIYSLNEKKLIDYRKSSDQKLVSQRLDKFDGETTAEKFDTLKSNENKLGENDDQKYDSNQFNHSDNQQLNTIDQQSEQNLNLNERTENDKNLMKMSASKIRVRNAKGAMKSVNETIDLIKTENPVLFYDSIDGQDKLLKENDNYSSDLSCLDDRIDEKKEVKQKQDSRRIDVKEDRERMSSEQANDKSRSMNEHTNETKHISTQMIEIENFERRMESYKHEQPNDKEANINSRKKSNDLKFNRSDNVQRLNEELSLIGRMNSSAEYNLLEKDNPKLNKKKFEERTYFSHQSNDMIGDFERNANFDSNTSNMTDRKAHFEHYMANGNTDYENSSVADQLNNLSSRFNPKNSKLNDYKNSKTTNLKISKKTNCSNKTNLRSDLKSNKKETNSDYGLIKSDPIEDYNLLSEDYEHECRFESIEKNRIKNVHNELIANNGIKKIENRGKIFKNLNFVSNQLNNERDFDSKDQKYNQKPNLNDCKLCEECAQKTEILKREFKDHNDHCFKISEELRIIERGIRNCNLDHENYSRKYDKKSYRCLDHSSDHEMSIRTSSLDDISNLLNSTDDLPNILLSATLSSSSFPSINTLASCELNSSSSTLHISSTEDFKEIKIEGLSKINLNNCPSFELKKFKNSPPNSKCPKCLSFEKKSSSEKTFKESSSKWSFERQTRTLLPGNEDKNNPSKLNFMHRIHRIRIL